MKVLGVLGSDVRALVWKYVVKETIPKDGFLTIHHSTISTVL
jgi:hypothetical protein